METEQFQLIKEIFHAALERRPEERDAFLAAACGGDEELRRKIEALLARRLQTDDFLETPAIQKHAGLFAREDHSKTAEEYSRLKVGEVISHYQIVSPLGKGGMGEVYLARDTRIGRKAAIKVLSNELFADEERVRRFEQEALTVSHLNHPNIVTVYDIEITNSPRFIATEFVEGLTLRQKLKSGRLKLREVLDIGAQIAAALAAAHSAGVAHRDIKPENVMLRDDGYVKVLDFGIAKRSSSGETNGEEAGRDSITATGAVIGTAGYMSPEQARGYKVDARTDIFSLGVTIYEMTTGQSPFGGETRLDVIAAILTKEPEPLERMVPEAPVELRRLVSKAFRKKPEERYQTGGEILAELEALKENFKLREKIRQSPPLFTPDVAEDDEESLPLLSEFDFSPRLQNWLRRNPQGGKIALGAAGGALIATLLSWVVRAACICVTFGCSGKSRSLIFGYLAEPNAALFYLVGVPVTVMTAFHLINLAHVMMRRLVSGQRLIMVNWKGAGDKPSPLAIIAQSNRRLCRALIPVFAMIAVVGVCVPEYLDRDRLAFGWVQALSVRDLEGKNLTEIRRSKILGEVPLLTQLENESSGCTIFVSKVDGGHAIAERSKWRLPFLVFLAVALGLQIVFTAFAFWIATKIFFLFVTLSRAVLDRPGQRLKIVLDFEDPKKRFGLIVLDTIHNALLTMVVVASVALILERVTNLVKGTSIFDGVTGPSLFGQALLMLITLGAIFLALVTPGLIFVRLIETALGRHLERIDMVEAELRKLMAAEIPAISSRDPEGELKALYHRREMARQQRPWPRENPLYRWLMLTSVVLFFVVPLSIEYIGSHESSNVFLRLAKGLCFFC